MNGSKQIIKAVAWVFVLGVILYAALSPTGGVVFQGGWGAIGVGLIGLGLCKAVYDRRASAQA